MMSGTQVIQRLDVRSGEIKQCATYGWLMTIAGNFDTMSSDMIITDALHLENGVVATMMLPFRLRSGTHTNWFPQSVLLPIRDELT